jgi:hypothetical protein
MMRGLAVVLACALFVLPLLSAPRPFIVVIGLVAAVLALVGIAVRWRWAVTAAACAFLVEYASALSVSAAPVDFLRAAGFGLALLLLLHTVDFARRVGSTAVDPTVRLAHLRRWLTVGGGTLTATVFVLAMTGLVGPVVPLAVAPLAAALGAFGAILALAAMVRRSAREGSWLSRDELPSGKAQGSPAIRSW